jgi:hypothetical protein
MANPNPSYHHLLPQQYQPGSNGRPRFATGPHAGLAQVARRLRKTTKNGKEVCDFLLGVMRDPMVRMHARIQAAELIMAYAYGKPRETIELVDDTPALDRRALITALSPEDRATLERLLDLALARAAQASAGPVIDMPAASMLPEAQHASDADPA